MLIHVGFNVFCCEEGQELNIRTSNNSRGILDCMRKIYLTEGMLSFWKGILPPLIAETQKKAWKFTTFEQFKKLFAFSMEQGKAKGIASVTSCFITSSLLSTKDGDTSTQTHDPQQNSSIIYPMAGLGTGLTEAVISNPFEHVKVQMQSNKAKQSEAPSTIFVARKIGREQGLALKSRCISIPSIKDICM